MTDRGRSTRVPELPPLEQSTGASQDPGPGDLGIVMGGGGARAAYQIGFLRCAARLFPNLRIPYVTGVSAGAINAALLASHHGTFIQAVEELTQLWGSLTVDDVFRTDTRSLIVNLWRWGIALVSGGNVDSKHARSLVDTQPLRSFLEDVLHPVNGEITGIAYNLETGRLKAAAISTSRYSTGQSITWVQGKDVDPWQRPHRRSRGAVLTVEHVMASTALPLFFPAVELEDGWHGDGSVRLTAPLSPALHLGARRIIAVSTRHQRSIAEADDPMVKGYPPPAQVAGTLMNSVFLDLLDQNAMELERFERPARFAPGGAAARAPAAEAAHPPPVRRPGEARLPIRGPAPQGLPLSHPRSGHARHPEPRSALVHPVPARLPARAHGSR